MTTIKIFTNGVNSYGEGSMKGTALNWVSKKNHSIQSPEYPIATKKLSIVIPGYNEEERIALTMRITYAAALNTLDDFEIIVIDDGSTDTTYEVALEAANELGNKVKVINQKTNKGVGHAFQLGLQQAAFPQLCLIPGDNAFDRTGMELIFSQCGLTPLVIAYRQNMDAKTPLRYFLSRSLTLFFRCITGFKIQDAHGLFLLPVAETRSLGVKTSGYGYHVEILSRLLIRLGSFLEVPVTLNPKPDSSSSVMHPYPLFMFSFGLCRLFCLRLMRRL